VQKAVPLVVAFVVALPFVGGDIVLPVKVPFVVPFVVADPFVEHRLGGFVQLGYLRNRQTLLFLTLLLF
jgi:hypothetical protein